MFALESPAVVDGLDAWKAWKRQLGSLSAQDRKDPMVVAAIARAEQVIRIFQTHPQGMSAKAVGFKAAVRASRAA